MKAFWIIMAVAVAAASSSPSGAQTPQPMLLRPSLDAADSLVTWPPFIHWDLREFPNCKIPWGLGANPAPDFDGTPDPVIDRVIAAGVFATSFAKWEAVSPALIGFLYTGFAPAAGIALDGYNTLGFGDRALDDIQVVMPGNAVAAGGDVVTPGPNNILETYPTGDDVVTGNAVAGYKIVDGGNMTAETQANFGSANALGLTGIFCNKQTGVIQEADIVFNPDSTWVLNPDTLSCDMSGLQLLKLNLEDIAIHEIGHFIGIGHALMPDVYTRDTADGISPTMYAHPNVAFCGNHFAQTLENADTDPCNFLYCPDLGDAPDPCIVGFPGFYPSLVHKTQQGRTLNGLTLDGRLTGAEHIFGIKKVQRNRMWTYEWLAVDGGDANGECEANVTNADPYDDGVTWTPDPPVWGRTLQVTASVAYAADQFGRAHDYATRDLWVNSFLDLNQDCVWDDAADEHFMDVSIHNPPLPAAANDIKYVDASGSVLLPTSIDPDKPMYLRTRLDWGENVGQAANIDGTLSFSRYAAQFGEVEDYPLWCREKYEVQWLQNTTAFPMLGVDMVFVGPPGVDQTVALEVTSSGCPVGGVGTVSSSYDGTLDETITTFGVPPLIPPLIWWRFGRCVQQPVVPPLLPPLTLARTYWVEPSVSSKTGSVADVTASVKIPSVNLGTCTLGTLTSVTGLQITVGTLDAATGGWIGGYDPITHEWDDTLHVSVSYRVAPTVVALEQLDPCDPYYLSLPQTTVGDAIVVPNRGFRFNLATPADIQLGEALIVETTTTWSTNTTENHQITEFPNPLPEATGVDDTPRPVRIGLTNHPNPFNPSTTITFSLPAAASVSLEVYDVQGRLVRTLISGDAFPIGSHDVVWNGKNNRGVEVSSGVYFYRLTAGAETLTRKAVLLK